jgi:hypothetical protein
MFLWSKLWLVPGADNLTGIYKPIVYNLDNVGSLTSHKPIGLHGLFGDSFTLLYFHKSYI